MSAWMARGPVAGDGCPTPGKDVGTPGVRVRIVGMLPTRRVAQAIGHAWNAVVTSNGRGTLLIRRRNAHPSNPCPLLRYEVRRIDG